MIKRRLILVWFVLLVSNLYGCQVFPGQYSPTPTEISSGIETTEIARSTSTPEPPHTIFMVDRLANGPIFKDELESKLIQIADERDWRFELRDAIPSTIELEHAQLVVVVGGEYDLADTIRQAGDSDFILLGVEGASTGPGVAVIGPEGVRKDEAAFIAGYIAAIVTPDWRVGVLGPGGIGSGQAVINGFLNGAVFFCGLCRPAYPPFHAYPISAGISGLDPESTKNGFAQLQEFAVRTIYLSPELSLEGQNALLEDKGESTTFWLGSTPSLGGSREQWLATIAADPSDQIDEVFTQLKTGNPDVVLPLHCELRDVNTSVITPGKLQLIRAFMEDLERGVIDTGIDPLTGEER